MIYVENFFADMLIISWWFTRQIPAIGRNMVSQLNSKKMKSNVKISRNFSQPNSIVIGEYTSVKLQFYWFKYYNIQTNYKLDLRVISIIFYTKIRTILLIATEITTESSLGYHKRSD